MSIPPLLPVSSVGDVAAEEMSPDAIRTSTVALSVLFTVYFFSSIDRSIFGILAQPIKEELLLADWQLGFLTGFAFSAVYLVFGFPMAKVADKGNRVTILSVCMALWSIMTAVNGLASTFIQLTFARMGVGIGEAACLPASHSLISDYFPPRKRTKALATFGLGYPIGALVGMMVGGFIADNWGWRAAFFVVGIPGLLLAVFTWLIVREPPRGRYDAGAGTDPAFADPKSFAEVWRAMWQSRVLRQMLLGVTIMATLTSPIATFISPYLARKFPLTYTELGVIVAVTMMLGASISTYGGGIIAQRLAQRDEKWLMWFPGITLVVGMPFYMVSLSQENWIYLAIWLFFGAVINATYLAPCYTVLYNRIAPGGRAKAAVNITVFIVLVGQSFGPLVAGLANDFVAAMLFADAAPQGFMAACPGGQAVQGAPAALDAACRGAVVDATQLVLLVSMAMTVWPALHFFLAGRAMKNEMAAG